MSELCISCGKNPVDWPRVCEACRDHEAQAELAARYRQEGTDPEEMRCKSCGMIYDEGMRCTYCGDPDPLDLGEPDDEYDDEADYCDVCGSDLSLGYPEDDGCPHCLPCGGQYAPGSEECDWCAYSDECAKEFL